MLFSERHGYKPIREIIQKESMDEALRNGLWNAIDKHIWQLHKSIARYSLPYAKNSNLFPLIYIYYDGFLKQSVDSIPQDLDKSIKAIRQYFISFDWHMVYSFIEFTLANLPDFCDKQELINQVDIVLQRENSAYRIINKQITEITSEQEIQSIEEAIQSSDKLSGVQQHLQTALKLMTDRTAPDYRNSIKESISAVESLCKIIMRTDKATLGQVLKSLEESHGLHPALKSSLSSLYGYTSDADGIRHAMLEESTLTFIDAKFMLVSCTNFINYLISKTNL